MPTPTPSNTRTGSTTWGWKKVKISGTRPPGQRGGAKRGRWGGLDRRDPGARLTLTIRYRGGAEAWWLVEARGRVGAFPGHMALHDVMSEINRQWAGPES